MKNRKWMNRLKRGMAGALLACMLLGIFGSGGAGNRLYGESEAVVRTLK